MEGGEETVIESRSLFRDRTPPDPDERDPRPRGPRAEDEPLLKGPGCDLDHTCTVSFKTRPAADLHEVNAVTSTFSV
ncbi:hypothetical protein EYF80_003384 [Liparis tanakae]|uniref:Uncharacterized protein n=1 Tax=Liparis tanakae TaxID=230148 RepID=A0A4Z2J7Z4_9TELE|nr:hypothetical protein EYF80_003384 [Liparis tanakae]